MKILKISSKESKIFKELLHMCKKKNRDISGKYIIDGYKLAFEAIDSGLVEMIVINEDIDGYNKTAQELISYCKKKVYINKESEAGNCDMPFFVFMEGKLFSRLTQLETSQGVLTLTRKYKKPFSEIIHNNDEMKVLVLDRLQDPGNIGTLIRTAEATGFNAVINVRGGGDIYSQRAVRASAGSILRIPIVEVENEKELINLLLLHKFKSMATDPSLGVIYSEADYKGNIAIIIGNEGRGVSDMLLEDADIKINIPMLGDVESLNAAVCGTIIMYETLRNKNIND